MIANHLNALHSARKAFIENEASEKLRRALQRKTRTSTSIIFETGDHVYYKRQDQDRWHGPGVVIGVENKQVFVKHGGEYYRVNPCHLRLLETNGQIDDEETNGNVTGSPHSAYDNAIVDEGNSVSGDHANEHASDDDVDSFQFNHNDEASYETPTIEEDIDLEESFENLISTNMTTDSELSDEQNLDENRTIDVQELNPTISKGLMPLQEVRLDIDFLIMKNG